MTADRNHVDRILSLLLVAAAIAVAAAVVHREFIQPAGAQPRNKRPVYVAKWETLLKAGRIIGDSAAPIKLVEFADIECPSCSSYNNVIKRVRARMPTQVAVVFVHLPLQQHRFARPAALASECADKVGRFEQIVDAMYEEQRLLGIKPWTAFAAEAGVRDTIGFANCMRDPTTSVLIDAGVSAANALDISATPTVILNGWRFSSPPGDSVLVRAIERTMNGERP